MRMIPLHCVVLMLGYGRSRRNCLAKFPDYEQIDDGDIAFRLTGPSQRFNQREATMSVVHHQMLTKLKLGERVVIDICDLNKSERLALSSAAVRVGIPVFYLICDEVDKDAQRGDGLAEVIDYRNTDFEIVRLLSGIDYHMELASKWEGVTVLGDVHGMYQSARQAIDWARQRNHFLVFSGDIVDYGPGSLEVADEVYGLVTRGQGILVLGNHERKIMRWIDGMRVRLSDGNRVTTRSLQGLGETARQKWIGRFRGLYQNSRIMHRIGTTSFVHAAFDPSLWREPTLTRDSENLAFFGEIDQAQSRQDRPVRSYSWVDAIPAGHSVIVGHDIRSTRLPVIQTNSQGGQAIFLDTGSGKGGHLSSADFRFTETGLRLSHFNIF